MDKSAVFTAAIVGCCALLGCVTSQGTHQVTLVNNCTQPLVMFQLTNGAGQVANSVTIAAGLSTSYSIQPYWGGRFWARYVPYATLLNSPAADTLFEITFDGAGLYDFYDISLVDGFTIPIQASPIASTVTQDPHDVYSCQTIGCTVNLLPTCNTALEWMSPSNQIMACESACTANPTNSSLCCTYPNNTTQTCPANQFSLVTKAACPDAYTYAYDDHTSTFTCPSVNNNFGSSYIVTFCPAEVPQPQTPRPPKVDPPTGVAAAVYTADSSPANVTGSGPHVINVVNYCNDNLTIYRQQAGSPTIIQWEMTSGQSIPVNLPTSWQGQFYARDQAFAPYMSSPAADSLIFFQFDLGGGTYGMDKYYVNLVNGVSVPNLISPVLSTVAPNTADPTNCQAIGCAYDFRPTCPQNLQFNNYLTNQTMSCLSQCQALGDPADCCTGAYLAQGSCSNNAQGLVVKGLCPFVQTYAQDATTDSFLCNKAAPPAYSSYTIAFCPANSQGQTTSAPQTTAAQTTAAQTTAAQTTAGQTTAAQTTAAQTTAPPQTTTAAQTSAPGQTTTVPPPPPGVPAPVYNPDSSPSTVAGTGAHVINVINYCTNNLTVYRQQDGGYPIIQWEMTPGQSIPVNVPTLWSGRFYARDQAFAPFMSSPAADSLIMFQLDLGGGTYGMDKYYVNLVNGASVPNLVSPVLSTVAPNTADPTSCQAIGCAYDFRPSCPANLQFNNYVNGKTMSCMSQCQALGGAANCCTGAYLAQGACSNNAQGLVVKGQCPFVQTYAQDSTTDSFLCPIAAPPAVSSYTISFCPSNSVMG